MKKVLPEVLLLEDLNIMRISFILFLFSVSYKYLKKV